MDAERRIEQVSGRRLVLDLPEPFENRRVEVIVLALEDEAPEQPVRRPPASIAGKMIVHGDIFDSVPPEDFEILK